MTPRGSTEGQHMNKKSIPEEQEAEKKPVLFQVPSNWDDLSEKSLT